MGPSRSDLGIQFRLDRAGAFAGGGSLTARRRAAAATVYPTVRRTHETAMLDPQSSSVARGSVTMRTTTSVERALASWLARR